MRSICLFSSSTNNLFVEKRVVAVVPCDLCGFVQENFRCPWTTERSFFFILLTHGFGVWFWCGSSSEWASCVVVFFVFDSVRIHIDISSSIVAVVCFPSCGVEIYCEIYCVIPMRAKLVVCSVNQNQRQLLFGPLFGQNVSNGIPFQG